MSQQMSSGCNNCGKTTSVISLKQCSRCESVRYCSSQCHKIHWKTHKTLCNAIHHLQTEENNRVKNNCEFDTKDAKRQAKLVSLIGKRCVVDCWLNDVLTKVLWDTGAEVSLISLKWLKKNVKNYELRNVESLLGAKLDVEGAGKSKIPYAGYTELDFKMGDSLLRVPFLVTEEILVQPIIGSNVIETMMKQTDSDLEGESVFEMAFRENPDIDKLAVRSLLSTEEDNCSIMVTTCKAAKLVPPGQQVVLSCKITACQEEKRVPMLFQPSIGYTIDERLRVNESLVSLKKGLNKRISVSVMNMGTQGITIPPRTIIGELHKVSSVTPANVKFRACADGENGDDSTIECNTIDEFKVADVHLEGDNDVLVHPEGDSKPTFKESLRPPMDELNGDTWEGSHSEWQSEGKPSLDLESGENTSITNAVNVQKVQPIWKQGGHDSSADNVPNEDDEFWKKIQALSFENLDEDQSRRVKDMLWQERDVFSRHPDDIGNAKDMEMDIQTSDEIPVQRHYHSIPKPLHQEVKNHIQNLLDRGWITKSRSAWSSPIVIVRKKDGGVRLCCDFRGLNKKTTPDKHPLPKIQNALDNLQGSKWFSVMDQSRAYYQGYMSKDSRKKTAFVTPWGFYEWVRIPFGLMNSGATFQRFMEETLSDYRDEFALPYLDDAIVYSVSFDDHMEHIRKVLSRFREKGIKLNMTKCNLFKKEVEYLGRVVNEEGYRMDNESIEAVNALKQLVPENVGQVRQMLGLLGYHRRNVQDYATIAKPLTDLLSFDVGEAHENVKKQGQGIPSKKKVEWKSIHQKALNTLIDYITSPLIMAYPDFSEEFRLHTDASGLGLGAILYQKQQGKMRVIGYGSRSLKPSEKNYHSSKLEFVALKWAITEKFRDYLAYADHFRAYTDNNPLLYVMETRKPNANTQRWISELAEYNFSIHYRPGVINKDADCLSRLPLDIKQYLHLCTETVDLNTFQALVAGVKVQVDNEETWKSPVDVKYSNKIDPIKMQEDQQSDGDIGPVIDLIKKSGRRTIEDDKLLTAGSKQILRERKNLYIDGKGVLRRRSGNLNQVVLPAKHREMIYRLLHIDMGHLGAERVFQLARKRVYWPCMQLDIQEFTQKRCRCIIQKKPHREQVAPLKSIISSCPMELITIDYLHLEKSSNNSEYVLLIVDHFTRFAQGYATKNKSALTAAKHLYNDFILRFGIPNRILHDQGREFENNLFTNLENFCGITKSRTTPYHPQCNGTVERMNSTLLSMLRTLPETQKGRWHESVNKMLCAYNATRHDSTGFSPYFLMYGREPTLPLDLFLGVEEERRTAEYSKFAKLWKEQMQQAYVIAKEKSGKRKLMDEQRWNQRLIAAGLKQGDRVLVKNVREKGGPGKIRSFWEPDVYVVVDCKEPDNLVYTVQKENDASRKQRVLHRNMLLLCDMLMPEDEPDTKKTVARTERQTTMRTRSQKKTLHTDKENGSDSSSDDEKVETVLPMMKDPVPNVRVSSKKIPSLQLSEDGDQDVSAHRSISVSEDGHLPDDVSQSCLQDENDNVHTNRADDSPGTTPGKDLVSDFITHELENSIEFNDGEALNGRELESSNDAEYPLSEEDVATYPDHTLGENQKISTDIRHQFIETERDSEFRVEATDENPLYYMEPDLYTNCGAGVGNERHGEYEQPDMIVENVDDAEIPDTSRVIRRPPKNRNTNIISYRRSWPDDLRVPLGLSERIEQQKDYSKAKRDNIIEKRRLGADSDQLAQVDNRIHEGENELLIEEETRHDVHQTQGDDGGGRGKRVRRAPKKLVYDEIGNPSIQAHIVNFDRHLVVDVDSSSTDADFCFGEYPDDEINGEGYGLVCYPLVHKFVESDFQTDPGNKLNIAESRLSCPSDYDYVDWDRPVRIFENGSGYYF